MIKIQITYLGSLKKGQEFRFDKSTNNFKPLEYLDLK